MPELHFGITADNKGFMNSINEIATSMNEAMRLIEANGGSIDKVIANIKNGLKMIGVGWGFKELIGQITGTRDEFQKLEIAFKTFLGSEEEANKLMNQMVHTAAITPFDLAGVADGAKNLLAFGVAAEDVNKTIISLGDIAAGLSQPLGDIIYLYGTTIAKPKMDTQDLMQMMGRGIPIAKELAKQFGVAESKVRSLITAGKVTSDVVKKAFESMTGEGSMFGGLMEAQSKSIGGKIANIQDSVAEMFNEIGKETEGVINATLDATGKIVENWQNVLLILADVAAAYGTQKAFLALNAGFQKAKTEYGYDAEIEQLRALVPAKEEEARSSMEQAVASGKLTQAKADEIAALREEAAAKLTRFKEAEELAKNEAEAAMKAVEAHQLKRMALEDEKQGWLDLYDEAINLGDAETAQAIATEVAATESEMKSAADTALTLAEEARTAATNAAAASEARETLETQINTAQTTGNTTATTLLTMAKEKLALAVQKVNAALVANKVAIGAAALIALGYAVYKCATYQTDLEKATKSAKDAHDAQEVSLRKERSTLEELNKKLEESKKDSDEWKDAKNAIVAQYGQYFKHLDIEIEKTGTLKTAYDKLTESIRLSAAARAMEKYRTDNDLKDEETETLKKVYDQFKARKVNKVDSDGNFIGEAGNPHKVKVSGPLLDDILDKVYKDITGEEANFNKKEVEYLRQIGYYGFNTASPAGFIEGFGSKMRKKSLAFKAGEKEVARLFQTTVEKIDGLETTPSGSSGSNYDVDYKAAEETYRKAAAKLKEIESNKKAHTTDEYEKAKEDLKSAKKAYEDLGGVTKTKKPSGPTASQVESKQNDAHRRLLDLLAQQGDERLKVSQDYEFELWQSRIDLMDDGEDKVLAQMALDHRKELASLEDRKNQEVKAEIARQKALFDAKEDENAAANKKYAKKVFNPGKDIEQTIISMMELNNEIQVLDDSIKSLSGQEVIDTDALNDAQSELNDLIDKREKLQFKLGDINPEEISTILTQYSSLSSQLLQRQKKDESDRLKEAQEHNLAYLKEFGTFEEQRLAIVNEYEEKIDKATSAEQRKLLTAQRDNALERFDTEYSKKRGKLKKLFTDPVNLTKDSIKEAIDIADEYLKKLELSHDQNIDEIEEVTERVKALREEYDNIDTAKVSQGLESCATQLVSILSLQKKIKAMKEANQDTEKEEAQLERNSEALRKSLILTGVNDFSNSLIQAADAMQKLSDITGNIELGNMASMMQSFGQNLQAAGEGMSSGGWIGAIIGGVTDILKQTITAITEHKLLMAQYKLEHEKFLNEMELMNLSFDADSWDTVFGVPSISKAMDAARSAKELYEKYHEVVDKKFSRTTDPNQDGDKEYKNLGASIFSGIFFGVGKDKSSKYYTEMEAMKKGFTELQAMAVNTTHYSGWKKFWGSKDKYVSLKDLAPQLWDANGDFNADAAKKFLEVNNQISAEQRQQIQNAIDLKDAYDDAIAALDAEIGDNLSSLADSLTDSIYNAIAHGTDAWADFKRIGKETIVQLGKELVKNFLISQYLESYTNKFREAYLLEDPAKVQEQVADITREMLNGLKDYIPQVSQMLEDFYEENGIHNLSFFENFSFDSVKNDFKSLLSDMESEAADFSDDFESMLKEALINGLMDAKYNAMLQEWYEDFAQAMDDGQLTDDERDSLKRRHDDIVQQALQDREAIKSIVGGDSYSQKASTGGWETIGQDQADELNGRFTAMTELEAINNTLVAEGNALSVRILETLQSFSNVAKMTEQDNPVLQEIRDMMFLSTGYLENISSHTKHLLIIERGIDSLNATVRERL